MSKVKVSLAIFAAFITAVETIWSNPLLADNDKIVTLRCASCTVYRNETSEWSKIAKLPYPKIADSKASGWVYLAPDSSLILNGDDFTPIKSWGVLGGGAGKAMAVEPDGSFVLYCEIEDGEFESLLLSVREMEWDSAGNVVTLQRNKADNGLVILRGKPPPANWMNIELKYGGASAAGSVIPLMNEKQFSPFDDGQYIPLWDVGTIALIEPFDIKPNIVVEFKVNGKSHRYSAALRYDRCLSARRVP